MQISSILDALPAFDTLRNLISQIGNPAKSKSHAWVFDPVPLTQYDAEAAYGSDWLPRKIIDIIPKHATREWRTWQTDQAEKLYEAEKALQLKAKIKQALIFDRLYGGGTILIGAQTQNPSKPLMLDKIGKGGLEYIHAFHRWELTDGDLIKDIKSPDFGKPEWFTINVDSDLRDVRIHRSRFAFFISLPCPSSGLLSRTNSLSRNWGQSVLEFVMRAIVRAEAAAENGSALMEEAKVDVIQVPNLPAQLGSREAQNRLITRFTLANQLKSSNSMLLLGGEEKFDRKQISFAGIPELMHAHLQIAAGAADIPVTILLGQAPSGLNATADSDIRIFYDKVRDYQTTDLQDALGPLDEALVRSTLGNLPKGVVYEWSPLWQMTPTEKADIGKKKAEAFSVLNSTGLFAPEELRPAVADVLIEDGFLPTLDQHMLSEEAMAELLNAEQEAKAQAQAQAGPDQGQTPGQPSSQSGPLPEKGGDQGRQMKVVQGGKKDAASVLSWYKEINDRFQPTYEETQHPRGPGGKFAEKPHQGGRTPAWIQTAQASAAHKAGTAHKGGDAYDLFETYRKPVTADEIIATVDGAARKIKQVEAKIARGIPTDTTVKEGGFKNEDGTWTDERHALHLEIVRKILSQETITKAKPPEGERPILTLLGGRGGSGKSWFTGKDGPVSTNAVYINSDDIQPLLPNYDPNLAALYHEEASHIANMVKMTARKMGLSITLDATMRSPKFAAEIESFKSEGYRTEGFYMFAAPHIAAERAVKRFMRMGRYVPPAYSLGSVTNEKTFDDVKNRFDKWGVYDNMGAKPELYSKDGDWAATRR